MLSVYSTITHGAVFMPRNSCGSVRLFFFFSSHLALVFIFACVISSSMLCGILLVQNISPVFGCQNIRNFVF